jgi:AraC family ethanolamine operon transcriptional activator
MAKLSARPELIQQCFDDFDDFCVTVRGWNLELRRFDRGPFAAELRQMVIGPLLIRSASVHRRLERELPSRFLEVLASGRGIQPSRPAGSRNQLLDRAVAYIDEHANPPQTVGEIAAAIGANERTLRRAFIDRFGIPPKSYLIAARLDGARRDLRRRAPEAPVVDVANRWGFWHMGDFAKRYRQMFGELPSETSRRRRPHRKTAPAPRI